MPWTASLAGSCVSLLTVKVLPSPLLCKIPRKKIMRPRFLPSAHPQGALRREGPTTSGDVESYGKSQAAAWRGPRVGAARDAWRSGFTSLYNPGCLRHLTDPPSR